MSVVSFFSGMEVDDIISYHDLVSEEKAPALGGQKGMNFGFGKKYSDFPMSPRFGNLAAISTNPIYGKAL
jgi:hypothetical protein